MPHIANLGDKWKTQVQVVAVSVLEQGLNPAEQVASFLQASKIPFPDNVACETRKGDIEQIWLTPAGVRTIPSTFLVRSNRIVWIGHPSQVASVVESELAGGLDVSKEIARAAEQERKRAEAKSALDSVYREFSTPEKVREGVKLIRELVSKARDDEAGIVRSELIFAGRVKSSVCQEIVKSALLRKNWFAVALFVSGSMDRDELKGDDRKNYLFNQFLAIDQLRDSPSYGEECMSGALIGRFYHSIGQKKRAKQEYERALKMAQSSTNEEDQQMIKFIEKQLKQLD